MSRLYPPLIQHSLVRAQSEDARQTDMREYCVIGGNELAFGGFVFVADVYCVFLAHLCYEHGKANASSPSFIARS